MGGHPINLQPCRAGTLRGYHGNSININIQKTTINNGALFPTPSYGYYQDPGLSKGEKWLLGIGAVATIGGAVLGALPEKTQKVMDDMQATLADNQAKLDQIQRDLDATNTENQRLREQAAARRQAAVDEVAATRAASQAQQNQNADFTAGAREVKDNNGTSTYTVRAKKNADGTVTGDTGYSIIAGKYKGEGGKALTHSEIMALAREIFKGKALKAGDIELPNEVTVNGKTYTYDKSGTVAEQTFTLTDQKFEIYQSGARQAGSHWVATLNGKDLAGQYNTEAEAKAAAEEEGKKQQSAQA